MTDTLSHHFVSLYEAHAPKVSFEFFPPKDEASEQTLWETITNLASLKPDFVSVTYGAGGSTRERTHATVKRLVDETDLVPAAHLTCVGASRIEIDQIAQEYWDAGVRHIVALRGDMPDMEATYEPHPEGYPYAVDLIEGLKKIGDFEISVSAYPEMHPEAVSMEKELDYLKAKMDAGASRAMTQFFYDNEAFLRFRDLCVDRGITMELVPGIMPIGNFAQVTRFAKACNTSIPNWLQTLFDGLEDHAELRTHTSLYVACEQCRILRSEGVEEFHFYTLNRAKLTAAICHILGVKA